MALANTNKAMVTDICVCVCFCLCIITLAMSTHQIVHIRKSIRFLFRVFWFAHIANIGFIVDI